MDVRECALCPRVAAKPATTSKRTLPSLLPSLSPALSFSASDDDEEATADDAADESEGVAWAFAPAFAWALLLLWLLLLVGACPPCRLHCIMHRTGLPWSMMDGASSSSDDGSIAPTGTADDAIRFAGR